MPGMLWKSSLFAAGAALLFSSAAYADTIVLRGARVHFDGPSRTVVDGPFAETKELVAGYWIWQVRSLEEAIEWVKRCPNPMFGPSEIEIRPLYDIEDFGEIVTPEVREQNRRLREETEKLAKK